MSGPAVAAFVLLPYTSFSADDAVLTLALAVPGVAAVVVDRLLRRVRRGTGRGRSR